VTLYNTGTLECVNITKLWGPAVFLSKLLSLSRDQLLFSFSRLFPEVDTHRKWLEEIPAASNSVFIKSAGAPPIQL